VLLFIPPTLNAPLSVNVLPGLMVKISAVLLLVVLEKLPTERFVFKVRFPVAVVLPPTAGTGVPNTNAPLAAPSVPPAFTTTVPLLTLVPPENVLAVLSVSVPVPLLISAALPAMFPGPADGVVAGAVIHRYRAGTDGAVQRDVIRIWVCAAVDVALLASLKVTNAPSA